MKMAKEIHDCMVVASMNAYVYWWIIAANGLASSGGSIYKRAYVLGQYAKYIRPGYHRVDATASPATGLSVSAYQGDDKVVIVAVNTGTGSVNQSFVLRGGTASQISSWQTTSSSNMAAGQDYSASGGSFTAALPGQSITTFVGSLSGFVAPDGGTPDASVGKDGRDAAGIGREGGLGEVGVVPGSGGAIGSGGRSGSGGASGNGGSSGAGGATVSPTGGRVGSGGSSSSGGGVGGSSNDTGGVVSGAGGVVGGSSNDTGGAITGAGGVVGAGSSSTGGSTVSEGTSSGCSCALGSGSAGAETPGLGIALLVGLCGRAVARRRARASCRTQTRPRN
jgi:hypothetical protein